ncbi:hypothetical protein D3C85_1543690 [compost metagenome]
MVEKIYVDGILDNAQNMTLSSAIKQAKFIVGASDEGEHYNGFMASLRMYDYALSKADIQKLQQQTRPGK